MSKMFEKFRKASIPEKSWEEHLAEAIKNGSNEEAAEVSWKDMQASTYYISDTYQVCMRPLEPEEHGFGYFLEIIWLSYKRHDRKSFGDWRIKQHIKNQIVGPECEAIEIYPAESRRMDTSNQYHLWCFPKGAFVPIYIFNDRAIIKGKANYGKSVQRPHGEKLDYE